MNALAASGPTPLHASWRLHFGDNPRSAQLGFDDLHRSRTTSAPNTPKAIARAAQSRGQEEGILTVTPVEVAHA